MTAQNQTSLKSSDEVRINGEYCAIWTPALLLAVCVAIGFILVGLSQWVSFDFRPTINLNFIVAGIYSVLSWIEVALVFGVILQVPYTWTWSCNVAHIHKFLAERTNGSYPIKPLAARLFGLLVSPALACSVWLAPFIVILLGNPDPGKVALQTLHTPPATAIANNLMLIMFVLITVNGVATIGAIANGFMLSKLVSFINDKRKPSDQFKTVAPVMVPLLMVFPAWWFAWTVPQLLCLLYFVLSPIFCVISFNQLARINEQLATAFSSK